MARRSLLFSPGDRPELMRKAPSAGADVLTFDLEDAVAPGRKAEAREAVVEVLSDPSFTPDAEVCVRLTATDPDVDLDALAAGLGNDAGPIGETGATLNAVMLPKVDSPDVIDRHETLLAERDLDLGIFAILETAAGILDAQAIAAADGTTAVIFGAEDLAADIGATRTAEGTEVLHAREHVVLAAAAADVDALDTVFTDFEDEEGLTSETEFALQLGYDGKLAIHPAQVPVINNAFTPDIERLEWAEAVLEAQADAAADDRGVFQVAGQMIDAPLIAQAERIMDRARAAGLRE